MGNLEEKLSWSYKNYFTIYLLSGIWVFFSGFLLHLRTYNWAISLGGESFKAECLEFDVKSHYQEAYIMFIPGKSSVRSFYFMQ